MWFKRAWIYISQYRKGFITEKRSFLKLGSLIPVNRASMSYVVDEVDRRSTQPGSLTLFKVWFS